MKNLLLRSKLFYSMLIVLMTLLTVYMFQIEKPISVNLDKNKTYTYLNSLEKKIESDTIGNILSKTNLTVIYFYPKDGTPNCTIQALEFSSLREEYLKNGIQVIGVSRDDLDSHKLFTERNELTIKLLKDSEGTLMKTYGALGEMKEYGNGTDKTDIIRSTYIVNKNGDILKEFVDFEVSGHAKRVLEEAKELRFQEVTRIK